MHENADHQAALASSVGVGMLSFAHRPAVYHFSAWTVNTTACLHMNFELALTQMTCIICDDSGEPGWFKLRLQDAPHADAFKFTLSSCTFSQLLMAALKDSLFKLRFRRCILRCLWAVAKGVNQKPCRLYSISAIFRWHYTSHINGWALPEECRLDTPSKAAMPAATSQTVALRASRCDFATRHHKASYY